MRRVSHRYTANNAPNDVLCHFSPLSGAVSHYSIARAELRAGADVTLCSRYQSLISYPCTTGTLQNPPPHSQIQMAAEALRCHTLHLGPEILALGKREEFCCELVHLHCGLLARERGASVILSPWGDCAVSCVWLLLQIGVNPSNWKLLFPDKTRSPGQRDQSVSAEGI